MGERSSSRREKNVGWDVASAKALPRRRRALAATRARQSSDKPGRIPLGPSRCCSANTTLGRTLRAHLQERLHGQRVSVDGARRHPHRPQPGGRAVEHLKLLAVHAAHRGRHGLAHFRVRLRVKAERVVAVRDGDPEGRRPATRKVCHAPVERGGDGVVGGEEGPRGRRRVQVEQLRTDDHRLGVGAGAAVAVEDQVVVAACPGVTPRAIACGTGEQGGEGGG